MITVFIDLETIPKDDVLHDEAWARKVSKILKRDNVAVDAQEAGLDPCFGQVLCIVASARVSQCGEPKWLTFNKIVDVGQVIARHFPEEDKQPESEAELLQEFLKYVEEVRDAGNPGIRFCAHNGKGFDYPFLALRLLANNISLPNYLRIAGKKPWDVPHLDTMEDFKMGGYNSHSQDALCNLFNIPTPKDDIDGSQVWGEYLENKSSADQKHAENLLRILGYCKKDVKSLIQICKKGEELGVRQYF